MIWRVLKGAGAVVSIALAAGFLLLAAAALLGTPGRGSDVVSHFTPVVGLGALVCAALGFACGLRLRGLFLALAALFLSAWIMAPEFVAGGWQTSTAERRVEAPALKILSINVWRSGNDLDAAEALIRSEQPDIIMLQEMRGDWRLLPQRVADAYGHMAYCMREYWCDTQLLSRLEFVEDITPPGSSYLAAARMKLPSRLGGGTIEVVAAHMPWPLPSYRQARTMDLLADMSRTFNPDTAIIAGDFNSTPWSNSLKRLDAMIPFPRRTRALFSFPTPDRAFTKYALRAPTPFLPIDHIYAGAKWRVVEIRRGASIGSDHYPVIAVLTMDVPAPAAPGAPGGELAAGATPPSALRGFSRADEAARP